MCLSATVGPRAPPLRMPSPALFSRPSSRHGTTHTGGRAAARMNVLKAIALKVISALLFAVMSALVRFLGERYPVGQIVFFRSAFAILPVVVIYAWRNELAAAMRTSRPFGHAGRG